MNEVLARLLGLSELTLGDPRVEFGFERPLPAWAWAIAMLIAAVLVWRAYRRIDAKAWTRALLAGLRGALLLLLLMLLLGPRLVKPNEREEQDWVLVLVDRSASLTIRDAKGAGGREAREEQLRAALEASAPMWRKLDAERVVVWLGFDAGAYELKPAAETGGEDAPASGAPIELGEARGRRTDINGAIDAALRRAAARPLSGIVLITDGRSASEPSRAILRRLEAEKIPVFPVALGDAAGLGDTGIRRIDAPRSAFTNDTVPIEVELEHTAGGSGAGEEAARAESTVVELVDEATGEVLDTRTVEWGAQSGPGGQADRGAAAEREPASDRKSVRLTARPGMAGSARWKVRLREDAPGATDLPDLVSVNNSQSLAVDLIDRPLRVLYVDGYPRWEHRFLKTMLTREESLSAAVLLLSPQRKYLQEGAIVLDALPRTGEEWGQFDVVVLGDVWPGMFTTEQLSALKQRVAVNGTGLVFIGGESATPHAWRTTPLGDLLPFSLRGTGVLGGDESASVLEAFDEPVVVRPTPGADRLGVLRLTDGATAGGEGGVLSNPEAFWPAALVNPENASLHLQWAQRIDPAALKPTAEVLATAAPATSESAEASPLLLSMRYGAGRVLYLATDEIWRWRFARGEPYTERFYIPLLRLLGRESLSRSGRAALVEVSPSPAVLDRPVRIELTLLEQSLVDANPASIRVRIVPAGENAGGADEVTLTAQAGAAGAAGETGEGSRTFAGAWLPTTSGQFRVEVIDPLLALHASELATDLRVWQDNDELRRPQADHELLANLAQASGGRVVEPERISSLAELLPNRRIRIAGEPVIETLWDTPLALLGVIVLATLEWVGRRLIRLA